MNRILPREEGEKGVAVLARWGDSRQWRGSSGNAKRSDARVSKAGQSLGYNLVAGVGSSHRGGRPESCTHGAAGLKSGG